MATNEIIDVSRVSKDMGDYVVKCPHCDRTIGIEGPSMRDVRGGQYQCPSDDCRGHLQVTTDAKFVEEL